MSDRDRRVHPRIKLGLTAVLRTKRAPGAKATVQILDISQSGALIACQAPLVLVGDTVQLEIKAGGGKTLDVKVSHIDDDVVFAMEGESACRVQWARNDMGKFGVLFVNLDEERKAVLNRLIKMFSEQPQD